MRKKSRNKNTKTLLYDRIGERAREKEIEGKREKFPGWRKTDDDNDDDNGDVERCRRGLRKEFLFHKNCKIIGFACLMSLRVALCKHVRNVCFGFITIIPVYFIYHKIIPLARDNSAQPRTFQVEMF